MLPIDSILMVADQYDAIVFDQWGVLHNGSAPYPQAIATVEKLRDKDSKLAVLSNSGKRSDINRDRITAMGFPPDAFGTVMTSGEALYLDCAAGSLSQIRTLLPITAADSDADRWGRGLSVSFTQDVATADAVLLMGLPDSQTHKKERVVLKEALALGIKLICSNPDRASPRADGIVVESPGTLAHEYADAGGDVLFYGKPHRPIFDAVAETVGRPDPDKVLMVGDSPEHDIAGAQTLGWHSLFIAGGLHDRHAGDLFSGDLRPTYILPTLR